MATRADVRQACSDLRSWMSQQPPSVEAKQAGEMALVGLDDCGKRQVWHPEILAGIAGYLVVLERG